MHIELDLIHVENKNKNSQQRCLSVCLSFTSSEKPKSDAEELIRFGV